MTNLEIVNMLNDHNCTNGTILENLMRGNTILRTHKNIIVSISGGSDSDIVLDIVERLAHDKNPRYVWFDTGLEYQATKDHLSYLELRYGIKIERLKAIKPIPLCCNVYGVPFLSKFVSGVVEGLQKYDFKFEDKPYDVLCREYPGIGKSYLKWWCNGYTMSNPNVHGTYNINRYRYLKEFMVLNPPDFKISAKCCLYSKKKVVKEYIEKVKPDLDITGIRRAEGGTRFFAYHNCFSDRSGDCDLYRPLFFYKDSDKLDYDSAFNIEHSKCYTQYGLKRTGCVGCPFSRTITEDLKCIMDNEPGLYKACVNIFGKSYEYTRKYKEFRKEMIRREKNT